MDAHMHKALCSPKPKLYIYSSMCSVFTAEQTQGWNFIKTLHVHIHHKGFLPLKSKEPGISCSFWWF